MDPLAREFAFLVAAAGDRIAELRAAPALSVDLERRRGSAIAVHLHAVLDGIQAAVDYRASQFASAVSDVQRLTEIRELRVQHQLVNGIEEMRPWLQINRHAGRVAPGIISFLDDACAAIVQAPADLICYPTTSYAYSSATAPFRDYLEQLDWTEPTGPLPIVLNYPAQEEASVFFHVLLLHELGHSADAVHDLFGKVVAGDTAEMVTSLEQAAARMADSATATRVRLVQIQKLRSVWLLEAICDAIAFSYAGPAYLLGFAAFLLRYKDDMPTKRHPSTQLRVRLLLEQAVTCGWADMMTERMPIVQEWLNNVATRDRTPVPHPFDDVETVLEASKETIWSVVDGHLGDRRCVPGAHEAEIKRVQTLLPYRILPVEYDGKYLDLRAIIAGGWLAAEKPDELDPEALVRATEDVRTPLCSCAGAAPVRLRRLRRAGPREAAPARRADGARRADRLAQGRRRRRSWPVQGRQRPVHTRRRRSVQLHDHSRPQLRRQRQRVRRKARPGNRDLRREDCSARIR
jgi:hypothetical protein